MAEQGETEDDTNLANCISRKTGTIEAKGGGGMGHAGKTDGSKGFGDPNDSFGGSISA